MQMNVPRRMIQAVLLAVGALLIGVLPASAGEPGYDPGGTRVTTVDGTNDRDL